jgi:hypothetical protein
MVTDPLFWRGVLCFGGGGRGDVLRRFFGPKDFFGKQIKVGENKEGVRREITHESKKRVKGKLTFEWCASLGCCPP